MEFAGDAACFTLANKLLLYKDEKEEDNRNQPFIFVEFEVLQKSKNDKI
jgi:hypothetical protein